MSQIALPLAPGTGNDAARIIVGSANTAVITGLRAASQWPFGTAVLTGPPRSGKTLLARWFAETGLGESVDDAERIDESQLFHLWNRAQEARKPLLIVSGAALGSWRIALPDLASRLGAALPLAIGAPDDAMLGELILLHAGLRGIALEPAAVAYLVPRCERSAAGVERLVAAIDRLSLERKQAPGMAIWRDALGATAP